MSRTDSLLFPELENGPSFDTEARLLASGFERVAGIDEAGRGPLAGPVVAAAVILDPRNIPYGLNDSKKLTEKKRNDLFGQIVSSGTVAWASLPAQAIDAINIRAATLQAMMIAANRLGTPADHFLVDGRDVPPPLSEKAEAMIKGDGRSLSIAAASIVAKVTRDKMMVRADTVFPAYGFRSHKGYGSAIHRSAIEKYGPCPLHRRSFEPLKSMELSDT